MSQTSSSPSPPFSPHATNSTPSETIEKTPTFDYGDTNLVLRAPVSATSSY